MFLYKSGVTERGSFAEHTLQLEREHRVWRPFAYTILEELQQQYSPQDEPLLERLYQSLSAGDRIFKITRQGRFGELDAWLAQERARRFADVESLVVHDVGASNGITSLELFELLAHDGTVELYATDYYDRLYLVTLPEQVWTVAFDVERRPLQAVGGRWVLSLRHRHPWRHPINRWLQHRVRQCILPKAEAALERYLDRAGQVPDNETALVREVSLFHPKCIELARRNTAFHYGRHDLFQPNPYRCHIIRALNVLTTKHFSEEQVVRGIEQAADNLESGGLIVLGRSLDEEDGRLRATAYAIHGSHLSEVWSLNGGYEDAALALKARLAGGKVALV